MENESILNEDPSSPKEWITNTFKKRECIKYARYNNKCRCGRYRREHIRNVKAFHNSYQDELLTENENWSIEKNTKEYPTDAFGILNFQGVDTYCKKSKYLRLAHDTCPEDIVNLLRNYWGLELPKLIISIHGGIANFGLQPKLKQAIQKGLIKVANTCHIWIITCGIDTGVVKLTGDMLKEYFPKVKTNLVMIGIAPWGLISERNLLIGSGTEVSYYADEISIDSSEKYNLNSFNTHFLLADDGTAGKYGCELNLRRNLENYLTRKAANFIDLNPDLNINSPKEKFNLNATNNEYPTIPLVCVVIEGGTNTIQTVLVNVNDKPPVPVVVCDGSGRAADLIAFTHKYATINPITGKALIKQSIKEQLTSIIMKTFDYNKLQADYLFEQLLNCVSKKDLISIYKVGNEEEIDVAILTASLQMIDLDLSKQMEIIMSWNRPDIAKKYVLLQGSDQEQQVLEEKMFEALCQNKVDFVKLFLEYGVNLKKFLTIKRLEDLYNYEKSPSSIFFLLIKENFNNKTNSNNEINLIQVGILLEKIIGAGFVSNYLRKEFKLKYLDTKLNKRRSLYTDSFSDLFKSPFNELLIWAILTKRNEIAMWICKRGDDECLAKILFTAKLNKSLHREADTDDLDSQISKDFKNYSDEFGLLAYGLLDECFKEDNELTNLLLTRNLEYWSNWTCLSLAVSANLKEFLSHAACQLLISDIWMGGIKLRKHVSLKVLFGIVVPPALFLIQFKSNKEFKLMPQTERMYEHTVKLTDHSASNLENPLSKLKNKISSFHSKSDKPNQKNSIIMSVENLKNIYDKLSSSKANSMSKKSNKNLENVDLDVEHQGAYSRVNISSVSISQSTTSESSRADSNILRLQKKLFVFYNAPITKFWQNTIVYILFLIAFSYIILTKTPKEPSWPEIFVLAYLFTYGIDKLRELIQIDSVRFSGKLLIFASRAFNVLDLIFIMSMLIAVGLRCSQNGIDLLTARLIYCVNSIYWVIKLMELLLVNSQTGTLIIIASKMLTDLSRFLILLVITLISFGLCRQAIRYPNLEFSWASVKQIFLEPYFMVYGEVYPSLIDPPCVLIDNGGSSPQCEKGFWIVIVAEAVFLIINDLLFLSILISSFNDTFSRIKVQSDQFWRYHRYYIVTSYRNKPLLPPPFIIFCHLFMIFDYIICYCKGKEIKLDKELKSHLSSSMIQSLKNFEDKCFFEYKYDLEKNKKERVEEKINHISAETEKINERIEDVFFRQNQTNYSIWKTEVRLKKLESLYLNLVKMQKNENKMIDMILAEQAKYNRNETPFISRLNIKINDNVLTKSTSEKDLAYLRKMYTSKKRINYKFDEQSVFLNTNNEISISNFDKLSNYSSMVIPLFNEYTTITDHLDSLNLNKINSRNPSFGSSVEDVNLEYGNYYNRRKCSYQSSIESAKRRKSEALRTAEENEHDFLDQMYQRKINRDISKSSFDSLISLRVQSSKKLETIKQQSFEEP